MQHQRFLAARFNEHRTELRSAARQLLGDPKEGEQALQEAWRRLSHSEDGAAEQLGTWLTALVGRISVDRLRERLARGEPSPAGPTGGDAGSLAVLTALAALPPDERLAFLLLDLFALPLPEVARILGRGEPAARLLAERARDRLQGRPPMPRHQVS